MFWFIYVYFKQETAMVKEFYCKNYKKSVSHATGIEIKQLVLKTYQHKTRINKPETNLLINKQINSCASIVTIYSLSLSIVLPKNLNNRNPLSINGSMGYCGCDLLWYHSPDSKVHGAHMGPTWGRQDPGGPREPCYLGSSYILMIFRSSSIKFCKWMAEDIVYW